MLAFGPLQSTWNLRRSWGKLIRRLGSHQVLQELVWWWKSLFIIFCPVLVCHEDWYQMISQIPTADSDSSVAAFSVVSLYDMHFKNTLMYTAVFLCWFKQLDFFYLVKSILQDTSCSALQMQFLKTSIKNNCLWKTSPVHHNHRDWRFVLWQAKGSLTRHQSHPLHCLLRNPESANVGEISFPWPDRSDAEIFTAGI